MSKWITGIEIIEQYGISSIELFDAIKTKGLQPYSPKQRRPFPRFDIYYIKKAIHYWQKEIDRYPFWCFSVEDAERRIKELQNELNTIKDESWENYGFPTEPKIKNLLIEKLLKLYYKIEKVAKCFTEQDTEGEISKQNSNRFPNRLFPDSDSNKWLEVLRVGQYSNEEILFQEHRRLPKRINYTNLGFKNNKTNEWKTLIDIISNDGNYNVGKAGLDGTEERKEYDRKIKLMNAIDKKLLTLFEKEFGRCFTQNFHIYELNKTEGAGTYKFKFKIKRESVEKSSKYANHPVEKLTTLLKGKWDEYLKAPEDNKVISKQITEIKDVLILKHGMKEDQIKKILDPNFDSSTIQDEFSKLEKGPIEG